MHSVEIVMVRLQGDFAKPPEKRFNYKHCFDALFRVCVPRFFYFLLPYFDFFADGEGRRGLLTRKGRRTERDQSSINECKSACFVSPYFYPLFVPLLDIWDR